MVYNVGSNCQETLYSHLLTFVLPSCLGNELMIKEIKTHRGPRGKNCNVLLYNSPYLKGTPPNSPFCLKFYSPPPKKKMLALGKSKGSESTNVGTQSKSKSRPTLVSVSRVNRAMSGRYPTPSQKDEPSYRVIFNPLPLPLPSSCTTK